jgi:Protein of unknown function (DUF3631)
MATELIPDAGLPLDFSGKANGHEKQVVVDGVQLLDDLVAYYQKYVRLGQDEYDAIAVWVLHCHAFLAFNRTPYLSVSSPSPECGKTQLLEVTELVVPNPWLTMSVTNAVLARKIDISHPVLMLDEIDNVLAGDKELLAAIKATINSGYKRSGSRSILEPIKGGGWVCKELSTFCPKVLSGISGLPPATKSRCIPIEMERMLPGDRVEDLDEYTIEPEAGALYARAQEWVSHNLKRLRDARPAAPPELGHRQREVCRPLLAVVDLVGGEWPGKLRSALSRLFAAQAALPTDDIKEALLRDIKEVFADHERITSADLVTGLGALDSSPWATWGKAGKPITATKIAWLLRDYKIFPKKIRIEVGSFQGYERSAFESAWRRYLRTPTPTPDSNRNTGTSQCLRGSEPFSDRNKNLNVPVQNCEIPNIHAGCSGVPVQTQGRGQGDGKERTTLPSCPACGSFALYPLPQGGAECQTCGGAAQ